MTASLIDGKKIASDIRKGIKISVSTNVLFKKRPPGLAVILVGDDPASSIYVHHKQKACADVGFHSRSFNLPNDTSESKLLSLIDELNEDANIDGILVQLPLPMHIDPKKIIESISPTKDVDGFHPYNLGRLAQGHPALRPCTPYGVIQLLTHYDIPIIGRHAIVVGASNIVGRPMALEFLLAKATVTICHRATQKLNELIPTADIVVVATGSYNVIKPEWMHDKQTIIDIGMHRHQNGTIHGDVNFNEAIKKVRWITPVPGGVGPMTITTLLQNTLHAAYQHLA